MEGASKPCPQCHIGSPLVVNIGIFQAPETVKQHDKNDEQNACIGAHGKYIEECSYVPRVVWYIL